MLLRLKNSNVCLVHVIWDLSRIGGAERNLVLTVKGLSKLSYRQLVISIGNKGSNGEEVEEAGIPVIALHAYPLKAVNPLITLKLLSLFRLLKPRIVHSHLNYNALIAAYLAKTPIIIRHEHNIYPNRTLLQIFADRLTDKLVDRIIACTEQVKRNTMERCGVRPDKINVIKYCIDIDGMIVHRPTDEVRQSLGITLNNSILLTVATLTEKKGHEFLLKAALLVLAKYPTIKFVLVGDGPKRATLTSMVHSMCLESNVIFTGTRTDLPDLFSIADLFILPSLYEGMPLVLMMAQAMGIPCIATSVGGTSEAIIPDITGILVPPRSPEALSEAIVKLLSAPLQRRKMSIAAKQFAWAQFSMERYFGELDRLYKQLIKDKVDYSEKA